MERRGVRYQAAVVRDDHVLLLRVFDRADGARALAEGLELVDEATAAQRLRASGGQ